MFVTQQCEERGNEDIARGNESPSPHSPAPSLRPPRRGVNLTEVLISMGILTLGLLGVASLFPVGSHYMAKADIANNGSALAQAVMNDLVARGMLNPSAWLTMVPNPRSPGLGAWNTGFPADGKYCPARTAPNLWPAMYVRPFAESLNQALSQPTAASDPTLIGKQFGSAFVIDPIGVAAMADRDTNNNQRNVIARPFPASVFALNPTAAFYNSSWQAWGNSANTWPIRRLTFQQSDGWPMTPQMASYYFQANDDLATDLPDRDDRPAAQNWEMLVNKSGATAPLARQWAGDYSWLATVVPTTDAARNGMARNPESFAYDVSVVIYHKRPLPTALPQTTAEMQTSTAAERAVRAAVITTGLTGGELLLTDLQDNVESPFMQLKVGQWIMLCGPHPNSTTTAPRFTLLWYQVLSIDTEGTGINNFDPRRNRVVAVRGPEWPWQPAAASGDLANNLCVGICRGAVAVHTKTLRLEGRHSAAGAGMSLFVPSGVSPPDYVAY